MTAMVMQRKCYRRVISGLMLAAMAPVAGTVVLNCRPEIKYECRSQGCERITEDFRHAEYFILDTAGKTLVACLWTACYEGQATVFP
jgi:hypothetical protein